MKDISLVICWITEQVDNIRGVWVFGSQVTGRARKNSDLDVIVESDSAKFTLSERIKLKRESKEKLGIEVDVVVVKDCAAFVKIMQITKIEQVYISPNVQ